jgi:AcrR family transcriptional regulator
MPATERPTLHQRRSRETRELILAAAYRVVSRRGYGGATVEEIVEEAGASMGALYYHFPNKEALFKSLLREHAHRTMHALASLPPPATFREAIDGLVAFWIDHIRSEAASRPLTLEFWAQATRAEWARDEVRASFDQFRSAIAAMLRIGQEAGLVRRELDPESAAAVIVAALEGVSLQCAIDDRVDIDAIRAPLTAFIERFIATGDEGKLAEAGERVAELFGDANGGAHTKEGHHGGTKQ